ncbi:hypothetical protein GobsT_35300 [Gemmata obscuriglobus]|uniref:Glycosyltransferase RgtA/B/C/D-like domain-containing protein n=1 Tax=Gemmata obscuriglobus TaxID=114 RepID=A0A2Z3H0G6_9BACT|nr:hypothetical protein C1280_15990 [Gemmata obscuriglobus]QEG28744.1 hypothetical protein GobsT_35300 [Gemmata obscuriglobus]VTS07051.1 Uncharacterized protein OS=Fibrisoma limi BUZ 3 GN=BN8_03996 PE=4 SV=1: PMT_2 [Gemmata obscuriglobus UQM 2246]
MLAGFVTLANVAKPVTVDDTAYLLFARHIHSHPTNPYGFALFWWAQPEPAMEVLCPPVVPYWLALGMTLFGEHVGLLKLWLFPFVLLLAWALNTLLVRFARGIEGVALPVLMLSPAVLPSLNLMLDVPALALALASVELFIRAAGRGLGLAALAGCVAGLAMQTKYSAFVAPAVIAWYGITHRRVVPAVCAVFAAAALFAGWEFLLVAKYGRSHFAFHAGSSGGGGLSAFVESKFPLLAPLGGYLGCLAVGSGLLAMSALRVARCWTTGTAALWCLGFGSLVTLPRRWTIISDLNLVSAFWQLSGLIWLMAGAGCLGVLLFRVRTGLGVRVHRGALFLSGWLLIELAAAIGLAPFPAARRVIGVSVVLGLVAARVLSRVCRVRQDRRPSRWVVGVGVGAGALVAAIDTLDAYPEKLCAEEAALRVARARAEEPLSAGRVWYVGHWGFQYYCERFGMLPLIAQQTEARAGDYLVVPEYPPDDPFPRPYAGFDVRHPPEWVADDLGGVTADDLLSAKTVPNYYGGAGPVTGRDHPRLQVRVYRLRTDWVMP